MREYQNMCELNDALKLNVMKKYILQITSLKSPNIVEESKTANSNEPVKANDSMTVQMRLKKQKNKYESIIKEKNEEYLQELANLKVQIDNQNVICIIMQLQIEAFVKQSQCESHESTK